MPTNDHANNHAVTPKAAAPAKSPPKTPEESTDTESTVSPPQLPVASARSAPQHRAIRQPAPQKPAPATLTSKIQAARKTRTAQKPAASPRLRDRDQLSAFGEGTAEAYWHSAAVVARGAEAFGKELASCSQRAVERNVAAATALSGVKSLAELWALQARIGGAAVDSLLAESARLTAISISIAGEAFAPFQLRAAKSVHKQPARAH